MPVPPYWWPCCGPVLRVLSGPVRTTVLPGSCNSGDRLVAALMRLTRKDLGSIPSTASRVLPDGPVPPRCARELGGPWEDPLPSLWPCLPCMFIRVFMAAVCWLVS